MMMMMMMIMMKAAMLPVDETTLSQLSKQQY